MKIRVQNIEYFEWDIPDELIDEHLKDKDYQELNDEDYQKLIDEDFNEYNLSVASCGDTYYEFVEIID